MSAHAKQARQRAEQALHAIGVLFEPGDVIEVRALDVDRTPNRGGVTYSGYFKFEAVDEISQAIQSIVNRAEGIYVVLNPVDPALLSRSVNRLQAKPKHTTKDEDITQWRWLYIDLDPVRPAGISSSEQEHQAALERAMAIRDHLSARDWPEPLQADSGNGAHLLYRLPPMPIDRARQLVEAILLVLDRGFSDTSVKVDKSTANASRLCKLYGTTARKGEHTEERPHRLAAILEEPEKLTSVPIEAIEAIASESADSGSGGTKRNVPPASHQAGGHFDLQQWIERHRLDVDGPEPWKGGRRWVFRTCPWNPEHRKSAYIVQLAIGAISAGCHHNSCKDKDWHALRDLVDPGWRTQRENDDASTQRANAEWEPPIPFHQFNLPSFPTEVLPAWLRAFVEALATATQTPADLAAMLVLSVIAAACAKKVIVQVKPGYSEPVNIYTVTALPPGNRKSAVFGLAQQPIADFEREENKKASPEIARQRAERKIKEATLKRFQEQAVSATGAKRDELIKKAGELAIEVEESVVAVPVKMIVDDCTSEKLPGILREQGGRIAVLSPEGDIFEVMGGRYSNNRSSNFSVYLKGHSGDDLRVDRVGRPPEHVPAPAITIGLTAQPDVIRGLAAKPGFRGRGLIGRILFSMPRSLLGNRNTKAPPVPEDILKAYSDNVLALLRIPLPASDDGASIPHALRIDPVGLARLQRFEQWVEPQLAEFGAMGSFSDWASKLVGAVVRIAAHLHMAKHAAGPAPWDIAMSDGTIEGAIRVGKYLIPHAQAAFAEMGMDEVVEKAKTVQRWIAHQRVTSFTRRDAHQGMRSHFRRADELDAPLDVLVERGFIRKRLGEPNAGAGRPRGATYDVNPLWAANFEYFEDFEKGTQKNGSSGAKSQEPTEKTELE